MKSTAETCHRVSVGINGGSNYDSLKGRNASSGISQTLTVTYPTANPRVNMSSLSSANFANVWQILQMSVGSSAAVDRRSRSDRRIGGCASSCYAM